MIVYPEAAIVAGMCAAFLLGCSRSPGRSASRCTARVDEARAAEERARIARELHDIVAHSTSGMVL